MGKAFCLKLLFVFCSICTIGAQNINHWETAIYNNDTWKYFTGLSEPDPAWRQLSFDDSAWLQGTGGFGNGDDDAKEKISLQDRDFSRGIQDLDQNTSLLA